jgi:predicted TPR repeat methyltransferase
MDTNSYKKTFETWDKIASLYQDKFMYMDLYNDTYDLFCDQIKKHNPQILEIGCGPGNITKYLLTKRSDFKIEAVDISPNMIKLAQDNNPAANFKVMDCRELDKLNSKFDGIICGFCMPYLSKTDCAKLIRDCACLLNSSGILYFSAIEGDYQKSGYEAGSSGDKAYVYYHQEDYLQKELKENKFELIDVKRKSFTKADGTFSTHIIFIAKK